MKKKTLQLSTSKFMLMTLMIFDIFQSVWAGGGTCQSVQNGLWNDASTWTDCFNGSGIPESDSFVVIKAGHEVVLNVDTGTINNLNMESGTVLRVTGNHSINTNEGGYQLAQGELVLEGNLTLNDNSADDINLGKVNGIHTLTLNTSADVNFNANVGDFIPVNTLFVNNGGIAYVGANITTFGSIVFDGEVSLNNSVTMTGATVALSGDVNSNLNAGPGYNLIINGNAVFNASIGTLLPADGTNLDALTINGNTTINGASDIELMTDWTQSYNGVTTIQDNTTFTAVTAGDIKFNDSIIATDQHININTAGTTAFSASTLNGNFDVSAASLVTDAPGQTQIQYNGIFNLNSDDTATVFNDDVRLGPSANVIINQSGSADVIFNDQVSENSGGNKQLTVNDVSGRTVFNGAVNVGTLTTNDGSGDDATVINANITTNQNASNDGLMTFNDPVQVIQNTIFTETGSGQIQFSNTLDAGDGMTDVDIQINSDATVILGVTGSINPFRMITTDAGGNMQFNGNVTSINNTTFNEDVALQNDIQLSSSNVNLLGNVAMQTHDLTLAGVDGTVSGVISGSGSLISNLVDDLNLDGENTYTGSTLINDGDLNLSSAPSDNNISGSSDVYLALNSSLIPRTGNSFDLVNGQTLSGEGAVADNLFALDGSIISPGTSPGVLNFDLLNFNTGSTYQVEIGGPTAGTDFDQIKAFLVDLDFDAQGGANLEVVVTGTINLNDQFLILEKDDGGPIAGTFLGLSEGSTVTANDGTQFTITYAGGINSNDVVLTGSCSHNITVTDPSDSGPDTLRQAVTDLCSGGTINFASGLSINLLSEILFDDDVTIDGSGLTITLSGSSSNRIFNVQEDVTAHLIELDVISGFSNGQGGAIYNKGNLIITDSWFDNNVSNDGAIGGGAIMNVSTGTLTISNSTFTNNTANRGGAIFNGGGAVLNIENSTFNQNGSNTIEGGAIHNRGTLNATNITVAGNGTTNTLGGGLFTWNGSQFLNNSLIADNNGSSDCHISLNNSSQTNSNSLIESGNCEAALTDDPQLQALANNGGNTLTMALSLTSPAVDAGSDALCTSEDQRGVARPQLAACDIGAYETEYLGVIYVDIDNDRLAGACLPGACWGSAFDDIQSALAVAGPGSQIWVAEGVYFPDEGPGVTDNDPMATFTIGSGVALYGGFIGSETELDQRNDKANLTVLSGDIDGNDTDTNGDGVIENIGDIMGTNAYHVMASGGSGVTVDGFTITAGHASGNSVSRRTGGGILCHSSDGIAHVFANNQWIANYAEDNGGAMFECGGSISVSTYQNNQADENGGAIAIFNDLDLQLSDVAFTANESGFSGGAVISANSVFDRIKVVGNKTGVIGGGVFAVGNLDLSNSLIAGNLSEEDGAGLVVLLDSDLTNVTLTGNKALQNGGGLFVFDNGQPFIELGITNSILWNNEDQSGSGTLNASLDTIDPAAISYTILQGSGGSSNWDPGAGIDSGNNLDLDPDFILDFDLMTAPTTNGNARLLPVSAAIGTGRNEAVDFFLDLDGNDRIDGGTVDMGAYEYSDLIFKDGFE